jgi:flagellar biosynthesis/type III secretory pathway M-ring protein FliF/YscJ
MLVVMFYAAGLIMIVISVLTRRVFSGIDRQMQEQAGERSGESDGGDERESEERKGLKERVSP